MITIYYVRHGETYSNEKGKLTGHINSRLNEKGILQAHSTAKQLEKMQFDFIISSPLFRAKQTAKIINEFHDKNIFIDNRLIERDYGVLSGKSHKKINRADSWNYFKEDYCLMIGVESVKQIFKRVYDFIDELKIKYPNKTILIVAHSGVGRAFNCYFNGLPESGELLSQALKNAEVKKYTIN